MGVGQRPVPVLWRVAEGIERICLLLEWCIPVDKPEEAASRALARRTPEAEMVMVQLSYGYGRDEMISDSPTDVPHYYLDMENRQPLWEALVAVGRG